MYFTDSVYMGWTVELSAHNSCHKEGQIQDGITCCKWGAIQNASRGIKSMEARSCCRRTGQHLCHITDARIEECNEGFSANEAMGDIQGLRKLMQEAEDAAQEAEEQAAAATVGAEAAGEKQQAAVE